MIHQFRVNRSDLLAKSFKSWLLWLLRRLLRVLIPFQDMHVITQHVQGRETYFALLGRHQMTGKYEIGPMT